MSVWRLSVAYIGPKSRTERPRKTKIGTEVAHVTRDSDTTFRVKKGQLVRGGGILWRSPAQLVITYLLWECPDQQCHHNCDTEKQSARCRSVDWLKISSWSNDSARPPCPTLRLYCNFPYCYPFVRWSAASSQQRCFLENLLTCTTMSGVKIYNSFNHYLTVDCRQSQIWLLNYCLSPSVHSNVREIIDR